MSVQRDTLLPTVLLGRTWLSEKAFELVLERPAGFRFIPGQSIRFKEGSLEREYSLTCGTDAPHVSLCVRLVSAGLFSPLLAAAPMGSSFAFTGPHGFFTFKKSDRPAVLVATGTGIAPFLSMVKWGLGGFTILHGVREPADLYYERVFRDAAAVYVACLSDAGGGGAVRVTDWAGKHLAPGSYDFYLCGSRAMIRDMTLLADERFRGSRVYTEIFY